jgi:hypothetical protein
MEIVLLFFFLLLLFDVASESAFWLCEVPETSKGAGGPSRTRLGSWEYLLLASLERGLAKLRVFLGIGEIDVSLADLV